MTVLMIGAVNKDIKKQKQFLKTVFGHNFSLLICSKLL